VHCVLVMAKVVMLTPKALANCSPGLERKRQPWVKAI